MTKTINRKQFADKLARDLRKYGYDNPQDWKEILRETRKVCKEVKSKKPKKVIKEFLDAQEIRGFLQSAYCLMNSRKTQQKGLIAETYIKTGMRNKELCNLRIENINFEQNYFIIKLGKGQKDRVGLLPSDLTQKLLLHIGDRRSGFLFLNERSNPFSARSIQLLISEIRSQAGLTKKITPHSLRHTFATLLIEWGVDIRKIQVLLGHENLTTTEIYTKINIKKHQGEITQALNNGINHQQIMPLEDKNVQSI